MSPELALALIIKRWTNWQQVARYQLPSQQQAEHENMLKLYMLYKKMKKKKNRAVQTNLTIPSYQLEDFDDQADDQANDQASEEDDKITLGNSTLVVDMHPIDYEHYFDYIRMEVETYNELFKLVEPLIKKQFLIKYPIPAHTRLQICLRYLASGESMATISSAFAVAPNTVSKVVTETCQAIWDVLKDIVLPQQSTELWKEKAHFFGLQWDFPHCIGAIERRELSLMVIILQIYVMIMKILMPTTIGYSPRVTTAVKRPSIKSAKR